MTLQFTSADDGGYERQALLPSKIASRGYPHRYQSYHEPLQEEYIQFRMCFDIDTLWFLGRTFIAALDWSAFFIIACSLGATFLCLHYGWKANEPLTLIGLVLVIPISFGEVFLLDVASLKASVISMYYIFRDYMEAFKKPKMDYAEEFIPLAECVIEDITVYIEHRERLFRIYQNLDKLSRMNDDFRCEEDWVRSMWSRGYQYQRLLMSDFERMRVLHDFRTPTAVRALLFATNYLFPIFLAPLYASYAKYGTWAAIFTCMVTTFMIVSLLRIQFSMEDPFDEVGPDDINLGMIKECFKHIRDTKKGKQAL